MNMASHCIRELEWDDKRKEWYAKLLRVHDGECIVMGDIGYILQYVHTNDNISIIETAKAL